MPTPLPRLALAALGLALSACTGVRGLDEEPLPLSAAERARVDAKVGEALEDREWAVAWNQAVDAGADRERLEAVALAALADDDGDAADMFEALIAKWGGVTPAARKEIRSLVHEALTVRDDWERAVEIELLTAEDAPDFASAWALYDDAPPDEAESLLAMIVEARKDREKAD